MEPDASKHPVIRIRSAIEQVAECLRGELLRRRWVVELPGVHRLAADLGLSRKLVEGAVLQLEKEGWLKSQGVGRKRLIQSLRKQKQSPLRVAILDYDAHARQDGFITLLIHKLAEQGHATAACDRTMIDLGMNVRRVSAYVKSFEADAWIVRSAPRDILRHGLLRHGIPAMSIYGEFPGIPIAAVGLDYHAPLCQALDKLIGLGHRRIVFTVTRGMAEAKPGSLWHRLLQKLEGAGIKTGAYNVPQWQDSPAGYHDLLTSLFRHTPPTALFIEEPAHVLAALQFCAQRGIRVPQDLSIISLQPGPAFERCHPPLEHITWDYAPMIRRILKWTKHIAEGREDIGQVRFRTKFIEGGTVAHAPRLRR